MSIKKRIDTPFQVQLSFDQIMEGWIAKRALSSVDVHKIRSLPAELAKAPDEDSCQTIIDNSIFLIAEIFSGFFPESLSSSEIKAIGLPFHNLIFNHTLLFKDILSQAGNDFQLSIADPDPHQAYVAQCCLILDRYYQTSLDFLRPQFVEIPNAAGISRFYKILHNHDFISIEPAAVPVEITSDDIDLLINNYEDIALWKQFFPQASWLLKGFTLITLVDVTVENALSVFKEKFLALKSSNFKEQVTAIFRSVLNLADIQVGFTLFDTESQRLRPAVFNHQMLSLLLPGGQENASRKVFCKSSYDRVVTRLEYFTVSDTQKLLLQDPESRLAQNFDKLGAGSFILIPIVKNDILLGILEIVSAQPKALNTLTAQKLNLVIPFFSDSIERLITRFHFQAEAVIQQYYTSIHPSVKWKFVREAEKFLFLQELGMPAQLPELFLKEVHPLYGQIDVKGSSRKRNECIQTDLTKQIMQAALVCQSTTQESDLFKEEIHTLDQMLSHLKTGVTADSEESISDYFNSRLHPKMARFIANTPNEYVKDYLLESSHENSLFYVQRSKYEQTITQINHNLVQILEKEQADAQGIFPHYYEHFITDGVEHTLYAGSSISSHKHFTRQHLRALRIWQIQTLCKMDTAHQHISQSLPFAMDVATLIFVYPLPITLRFKMDEKRFDVDGAYNVRFEMIKKRIDKANIEGTSQRVAQPGMLTIIYPSQKEEIEYLQYLGLMKELGFLEGEIQILHVETLQDVTGLKALRAKIKSDATLLN